MTLLIILVVILVGFIFSPKWTAAIFTALVVMFLYVWMYDPECHNWAKDHPEWHGKCGIQFAGW